MSSVQDGPSSSLFRPVPFTGNVSLSELGGAGVSDEMAAALEHAPRGACVGWGIPFEAGRHDPEAPLQCSEELLQGISDASLVRFEHSGHSPFIEEASLFAQTVAAFLSE